jgi:hypothetical protein
MECKGAEGRACGFQRVDFPSARPEHEADEQEMRAGRFDHRPGRANKPARVVGVLVYAEGIGELIVRREDRIVVDPER